MKRKFTWFPKLTDLINEVAKDMPDAVSELVIAITNYGTYGIEPEFSSIALKYAFMSVREDIDNSISARENGGKGGRPKTKQEGVEEIEEEKPQVKTCSKPTQNPLETPLKPTQNLPETTTKPSENPPETTPEPPYTVNQTIPNQSIPYQANPGGIQRESFVIDCLAAFNAIMGTTYSRNPHGDFLADFAETVPIDDVKAMITYKRKEWYGTKYQANLTPQTLFSPRHFEQYLHQSKMPKPEGEVDVDDYAQYV